MKAASAAKAVSSLVAAGLWPPFKAGKGQEADCSREDVLHAWVAACDRFQANEAQLYAAVEAWLAADTAGRWPSPVDVLRHVVRPTSASPAGCGRCNEVGLASVAIHKADKVLIVMAHCGCSKGQFWSAMRQKPLQKGEADRPRPPTVMEVADRAMLDLKVIAAYPHPTEAERRPGCVLPELPAHREGALRAFLDSFGTATSAPPDRYEYDEPDRGRW